MDTFIRKIAGILKLPPLMRSMLHQFIDCRKQFHIVKVGHKGKLSVVISDSLCRYIFLDELIAYVLIYIYIIFFPNRGLNVAVNNFDRSMINAPGPCVLFATPGMISGGFSLEVFKHWAPSEMNLITLPGYPLNLLIKCIPLDGDVSYICYLDH